MTNDIQKQTAGKGGAVFAKTTGTPYSGEFCAIQCITSNTKFTSITMDGLTGDTLDEHTHFPAGFIILGNIKSFTINTGSVLAYKADVG